MQMMGGSNILALDVGQTRVGVAIASQLARLPRPLATLKVDDSLVDRIKELTKTEGISEVVIGLPRSLDGDDTGQTEFTRRFVRRLELALGLPVRLQDEALTTKKALRELREHKNVRPEITQDSLAAVYILEDYLAGQKVGGKL